MIGSVVGNYRILEKLGGGGMGQVFRAEELLVGRAVAVKALRPELIQEPGMLERFQREAQTLSKLHHPNIVMLYSFFQEGGRYYMAMEYAPGQTLATLMRDQPKGMPWTRAVALTMEMLAALEYAHDKDVVHRDIKPANLMVQGQRALKVMDFGVARILGSSELTRAGTIVGTPKYMSPEQIKQSKSLDGRSDLYSVGLVLYEMLCGHVPFDEPSEYDLSRAQIEDPPPPLLQQLPNLPPMLENLVFKALRKAPQDRFESAWEFRQLLESTLREDSTRLKPPPPLPPPVPVQDTRQRVPKSWLLAGITLVVLAGAGLAWFLARGADDPSAPQPASLAPSVPDTALADEAKRLQAEIAPLRKAVEDAQRQYQERSLNAAQDVERFAGLLSAARTNQARRTYLESKLEAEHQLDRVKDLNAQYRQALQGPQGVTALEKRTDTAASALREGKAQEAKQALGAVLAGWQALQDYPREIQSRQDQAEQTSLSRLQGHWGDNGCATVSEWNIDGRIVNVTWPNQSPAQERILGLKADDIYTVVESPAQYRGQIYRYRPGNSALTVEDMTDKRAKTLKRCDSSR